MKNFLKDLFRRKPFETAQANRITELGIHNAEAQLELVAQLIRIRLLRGLSLQEVAGSMSVDLDELAHFEKGSANFTMSTLRKYAKAVDAELLLFASPAGGADWAFSRPSQRFSGSHPTASFVIQEKLDHFDSLGSNGATAWLPKSINTSETRRNFEWHSMMN